MASEGLRPPSTKEKGRGNQMAITTKTKNVSGNIYGFG
jgi:hypothetical protein